MLVEVPHLIMDGGDAEDAILLVLSLIDLSLAGNLFVPWGLSASLAPAALAVAVGTLLLKLVILLEQVDCQPAGGVLFGNGGKAGDFRA